MLQLRGGEDGERQVVFVHVLEFEIADDADDDVERPRSSGRLVDLEAFAERVFSLEDFADKGLVDDGDFDRGRCIAIVEVASGKEWRADGLEVAGADVVFPGNGLFFGGALGDYADVPG